MAAATWTSYIHTTEDLSAMDAGIRLDACKIMVIPSNSYCLRGQEIIFLNFSATTYMRMQSQMAGTSVKSMFWKALTVTWETKWIIQGKKPTYLWAWKAHKFSTLVKSLNYFIPRTVASSTTDLTVYERASIIDDFYTVGNINSTTYFKM